MEEVQQSREERDNVRLSFLYIKIKISSLKLRFSSACKHFFSGSLKMIQSSSLEPSSVLLAEKHTNALAWDEAEVIINHKFADVAMCVKWQCSDITRLAVFFQSWLVNLIIGAEFVSFKPLLTIDFVCVVLERQSKKKVLLGNYSFTKVTFLLPS